MENAETGERTDGIEASGTTCPQCEGVVETILHEATFRYGDGDTAVDIAVVLPVRRCRSCEFEFLDFEAERIKHEALCRHLGVLTPQEIRAIRERHGLSRAAFARLTGLGAATVARWETATLIQTIGNDRYLRLLASPEGMSVLRTIARSAGVPAGGRPPNVPQPTSPMFRCLLPDDKVRAEAHSFSLVRVAA